MRLACFMSGSGSNVAKIIEYQRDTVKLNGKAPFDVVVLFTDNSGSNTRTLAEKVSLPYVCNDILDFYKARDHDTKRDISLRPEYDGQTVDALKEYAVHAIALGGYMSILTAPLLRWFGDRIFNVHPADLSIKAVDGRRRYVGAHAVSDAIISGEKNLYSSTHIVREEVDGGEILMRSRPIPVMLPEGLTPQELGRPENKVKLDEVARIYQEHLKQAGDWVIYPLTLRMIAEGRYGLDGAGNVYVDGKLLPFGYRL
jgi:folate-dependent phosphoribosylglycinamide formyltransferase PurN